MSFTTKPILKTDHAKKDGTYPIYIRLTIARKVAYIPVGHSVLLTDWDDPNMRVRPHSKNISNVSRLNNRINKERTRIDDLCIRLLDADLLDQFPIREIKQFMSWSKKQSEEVIQQTIEKMVNGRSVPAENQANGEALDVISYLKQKAQLFREAKRNGYADSHEHLIRKLILFRGNTPLRFEDINFAFLTKLEARHLAEGHNLGGLGVYLRTLRARYNDAIKEGIVDKKYYPFNEYHIKKGSPSRKALSDSSFEQLQQLSLKPDSMEELARSLFMASYYLRGMNWMDMGYLKAGSLSADLSRLFYQRSKTKKRYSIAIHGKLRVILRGFLGEEYSSDGYVFPILTQNDPVEKHYEIIDEKRNTINRRLRSIGKRIDCEGLTFYSARHTYATRAKRKGVPTSAIQDALGHATEHTTQTYLESFEDTVIDAFDAMLFSD